MPFLENRDTRYLRDRGMIVIFKNLKPGVPSENGWEP